MKRPHRSSNLFADKRKKNSRARGEGGPVPVPRSERVALRSQLTTRTQDDSHLADSATHSLLSLATAAEAATATTRPTTRSSSNRRTRQDTSVRRTYSVQSDDTSSTDDDEEDSTATRQHNNRTTTRVASSNIEGRPQQAPASSYDDPPIHDSATLGLAMEYAAGVGLRTHVLEPTLDAFPDASHADAARFLGMNSRGEFLLVSGCDGTAKRASMERVEGQQDGAVLTNWWEADGDRFLSVAADQSWSDWWVQRCHRFDPGCEMYKLVTSSDETLGVVYFERNIVDRHSFGNKGRISLIRGIRVAPSLNPEVALRRKLETGEDSEHDWTIYKRISTLLFYHVLFLSVRYGTNAVGVNCPKNSEMESFYQSFMGPAIAFDDTGRRYFRMESEERWRALRGSFRYQVELWLGQLRTLAPMANSRIGFLST